MGGKKMTKMVEPVVFLFTLKLGFPLMFWAKKHHPVSLSITLGYIKWAEDVVDFNTVHSLCFSSLVLCLSKPELCNFSSFYHFK